MAGDDPKIIGDLALGADSNQFSKLFPLVEQNRKTLIPTYRDLAKRPTTSAKDDEAKWLAHRRALAAIALIRLDDGSNGWEVFRN